MKQTETMSDYLRFRAILGEYTLIGMPGIFTTKEFTEALKKGEKDFGLEIVTPIREKNPFFHTYTEGGYHVYEFDRPLILLKSYERKGVLKKEWVEGGFLWTKIKNTKEIAYG